MPSYGVLRHALQLRESLFSGGLHTLLFQASKDAGDLSIDEISELCDTMGPVRNLILTGPEPFLRHDLYQVCRTFLLRSQVRRLTLVTDGTQPRAVADLCRDLLFAHQGLPLSVKVSLDGDRDLHDRLKGRPGAFDDGLAALDLLKKLKTRRPHLGVRVTTLVGRDNASAVSRLVDLVFEKAAPDGHDFELAEPGSSAHGGCLADLGDVSRLHRLVLTVKQRYMKRDGLGPVSRAAVIALAASAQDLQRRRLQAGGGVPCSAGRNICSIAADGSLRFCLGKPPVGSLRSVKMDFRKLWKSPEAAASRKETRGHGCSCVDASYLKASAAAGILPALRFLGRLPWALDNLP